jgi:hypothetical protein
VQLSSGHGIEPCFPHGLDLVRATRKCPMEGNTAVGLWTFLLPQVTEASNRAPLHALAFSILWPFRAARRGKVVYDEVTMPVRRAAIQLVIKL